MDHKSDEVLEHLRQQLPDFNFIHFSEYDPWTASSIYSSVQNTMKVPDEKIRELCGLIPLEAKTPREAALMSIDFSCLSSEDYLCSLATKISDTLINTFKDERASRHNYAIIPKGMPIPIVRDKDGRLRCQYDTCLLEEIGFISLEFEP